MGVSFLESLNVTSANMVPSYYPAPQPLCDNHDDGETQALILCDSCGNLCGECDRVLHLNKKTKHHQRQVRYI